MVNPAVRVLFLGKRDDVHCASARAWCEKHFPEVQYFDGVWGDPLPQAARDWQGDLIVSYLSRWVVPASVLARARVAAINFHPATPEYPGIGCNNFALYEGAATYGTTCHHMAASVDTGHIIDVTRFPVAADETVASLLQRTYAAMSAQFERVMDGFLRTGEFPVSTQQWTRKPFTRVQFEALRRIDFGMPADEVARRVRATDYPPYGPYLELHGFKFKLAKDPV